MSVRSFEARRSDAMSVCCFMTQKFDNPTPEEFDAEMRKYPEYSITDRCHLGCTALDRAASGGSPRLIVHLAQKPGGLELIRQAGYAGADAEYENENFKGYWHIAQALRCHASPLQNALHNAPNWHCLENAKQLIDLGADPQDLTTPLVVKTAERLNEAAFFAFLAEHSEKAPHPAPPPGGLSW